VELNHLLFCECRTGPVDSFRKPSQMTRRNQREKMMLGMIKHAVVNPIDAAATLGACSGGVGITAVMHRPHREESGQALADEHRCHVPPQCVENRYGYSQRDNTCKNQDLCHDPTAFLP
jgi:hypothetical protein